MYACILIFNLKSFYLKLYLLYGYDVPHLYMSICLYACLFLSCRTDVWAIGCLLFAWWHGYSPYECELLEYGVKVVECTHLRVLSKIPVRAVQSREDAVITNVAESILMQDITNRPFLPDIMNVIKKKIAEIVKDE